MDYTPVQETKIHGTAAFPYSVYRGRIPEWIHSFPLHWHDDFELIYCTSGQIQVTLWGHAYTLRAQDLIVVLPHAVHSIEQSGIAGGEYFNILFNPSLFKGTAEDPCYDKYVLPFLNGEKTMDCYYPSGSPFNRTVSPSILSMYDNRKESYSTLELVIKSNLFLLLHHMNQYSTAATSDNRSLQLSCSRLKNALYYVQRFYDHDISIREVSEQCGFSESHFMKLFKELAGMSFNAYLVNYRLELAAKQLAETDYKVIDIAENCGFHNHSYFTRAFQKKYRKTPLMYRKDVSRIL
ncbi:MAG: AraC family transcriptional regulator [Lachnospiraceae bacterium]